MSLNFFVPNLGDVPLVPAWPNAGAPTNGTSGSFAGIAAPGDLLIDTVNAVAYQNTGTQASPTWTGTGIGGSVTITGGTINGAAIGGTTRGAGSFTTLNANNTVGLSPASHNVTLSPTGTGQVIINPATLGTMDNVTIGGTTPAAVTTSALHVDTGTKTAFALSGAVTLNKMAGVITSESLTTAAGADYTLTITNSDVAAADQVFASVFFGSSTTGTPAVATVTPGANSIVVVVQNIHASAAFNGTIRIAFLVVKN